MSEPRTIGQQRYVLGRSLGMGSQANTFEAVDKLEGRSVAIKQFHVAHACSWKEVELAEREARVLSALEHPLLPGYLEHFEEQGTLYLVMDKVEGTSVQQLLQAGRLGQDDVIRFLYDAAEVLAYLHRRSPPVIHRDIKPGNVIQRPDGRYSLVDFGSVRQKLQVAGGSTVVGTFGFMAPEQFQGRALPATDVYAVGATALMMLTGSPPEELPHQGLSIDVSRALGGLVDPALEAVLKRMLDSDPDERASDLASLLRQHNLRPRAAKQHRTKQRRSEQGQASPRPTRVSEPWDALSFLAYVPPPLKLVLHLLIALVKLMVRLSMFVVFQVVLPILFTMLSVFFGPKLTHQSRDLRRLSDDVSEDLDDLAEALRAGLRQKPPRHSRYRRRRSRHYRYGVNYSSTTDAARRKRSRVVPDTVEVEGYDADDESEREAAAETKKR